MKEGLKNWLDQTNEFATRHCGTEGEIFTNRHVVCVGGGVLVLFAVMIAACMLFD